MNSHILRKGFKEILKHKTGGGGSEWTQQGNLKTRKRQSTVVKGKFPRATKGQKVEGM